MKNPAASRRFATSRALACLTGLWIVACAAVAQTVATQLGTYPSRPVRVVVASSPGGSLDITARQVFRKLQERLDSAFVLDNRGGSSVALDLVVHSSPDGHTLFVGSSSNFFAAEQVIKVAYNVRTRLTPVAQLVSSTFLIAVSKDLPVTNLAELIAHAKANPKLLNYAFVSGGSASLLVSELLKQRAGIHMEGIGFKGAGPAYIEQMAGRIHVTIGTAVSGMPLVKAGKIRAIAVTAPTRSPRLPNIPTVRETIPDFDVFDAFVGVFAVQGTPPEIVAFLNREINRVLALPDIQKALTNEGSAPTPGTSAHLGQALITSLESARQIVGRANIRFE